MPITVEVPDLGTIDFPDDMPHDEISKAIQTSLARKNAVTLEQVRPTALEQAKLAGVGGGARMGTFGPEAPEEVLALPQVIQAPPVAAGRALAAGLRTVRDVLRPSTYLPEEMQPKELVVGPEGWAERRLTAQERAEREPFQVGRPLFTPRATALEPEGSDAERLLSRWSTPEGLALLPAGFSKAALLAMAPSMIQSIGQQVKDIAVGAGTEQDKRDRVNDLFAMAGLMAHGGLRGTPADLGPGVDFQRPIGPPAPGALLQRPGAPAPRIEPPAPIERVTPAESAAASLRMAREAGVERPTRLPRPTVPEGGVEPAEGLTAEREALVGLQLQIDQVTKANARTKADVQKLFPEMNRQQAAQLRDIVWTPETPVTAETIKRLFPDVTDEAATRIAAAWESRKGPSAIDQISKPGGLLEERRGDGEGGPPTGPSAGGGVPKPTPGPPKAPAPGAAEAPPVTPGTVTLYTGKGGVGGAGEGGSWFTANLEKAKTYGPDVRAVQVPADVAEAAKQAARKQGQGGDTYFLTREHADKAAPVEGLTPKAPIEITEEGPTEPQTAADFIAMTPKGFVDWKKRVKYGPGGIEASEITKN